MTLGRLFDYGDSCVFFAQVLISVKCQCMTKRPRSRIDCYLQLSFSFTVVNKSIKEDERRTSILCCGNTDAMASSTVVIPILDLVILLLFVFVVLLLLFDTPSKPVNNETWCTSSYSGVAVNVM
jgi:hypothetical protein